MRFTSRLLHSLLIAASGILGAGVSSRVLGEQLQLQNRLAASHWLDPVAAVLTSEITRSLRISSFLATAVVVDPELTRHTSKLQLVVRWASERGKCLASIPRDATPLRLQESAQKLFCESIDLINEMPVEQAQWTVRHAFDRSLQLSMEPLV